MNNRDSGVIFNAYPDSFGDKLQNIVHILQRDEFLNVFSQFYILPTMYQSDLDRGFSVASYDLNPELVSVDDLQQLKNMNVNLFLDFIPNHLSARSPQFQDVLERGSSSPFADMFIDWNEFWRDKGRLDPSGLIIPDKEFLSKLFMRKTSLPVLKVTLPDGSYRFYWNTFNQELLRDGSRISFLGQMDLNAESRLAWNFYRETLDKLSSYGASTIRLDAFAYLHKKPGETNFFNKPGTWDYLSRLQKMADLHNLTLLPEIHAPHSEGIHRLLADNGYLIYDFFFPGLIIHTIESKNTEVLFRWVEEIITGKYETVNMLGCHDGIPLLDLRGLLTEGEIDKLISIITDRGGRVKDLYGPDGKKIAYYQVNATFYSALGEDDKKLLFARAIQIFMPGTPLVWYLDLFAGSNDYNAADNGGYKEINRTNLTTAEIQYRLELSIVQRQLTLLRLRNTSPAFEPEAEIFLNNTPSKIEIKRRNKKHCARIVADVVNLTFKIELCNDSDTWTSFSFIE